MYQDNICLYHIKLQNGLILENCRIHKETKNIRVKGGRGSQYIMNFTDYIIHIYNENGDELSEDAVDGCEVIRVYLNDKLDSKGGI